jgi:hypothetical protein
LKNSRDFYFFFYSFSHTHTTYLLYITLGIYFSRYLSDFLHLYFQSRTLTN